MIAETLLLLNDDPSKPLNEHFNDSLVDLKNWLSNAIQYIATDDVIASGEFRDEITTTLKHKGALKVKTGSKVGGYGGATIYINEVQKGKLSGNETLVINVEKGDVLRITNSCEYVHLCGSPVLLDF